jgi:two-component system phosphate regulon response regulator PhoB
MSGLILVVEDEKDLLDSLAYNLGREGYETRLAGDGRLALQLAGEEPPPDLVILDVMLPDLDGFEVCRQLRQSERTRRTLVLMLTARGAEVDRVVGFEVGADDYVLKPFSVRELMLRVRALLRRGRSDASRADATGEILFGRLRLDPTGHRLWVDGDEVALTAMEFRLLQTFLERKGRAQSRDMLLDTVWGIQADVNTRTVDTHVKRLREKLGAAGAYVETLRGVGYRFKSRPDEEPA